MGAKFAVPHVRPRTLVNPANTFEDDFETANTSKWATIVGSPPVAGTYAKNGSNGLLISPANSSKSVGTSTGKWAQSGLPFFSAAMWIQFKAFSAGKSQSVLTVANIDNLDNVDIALDATTQGWAFDVKNADKITSLVVPSLDVWYRLRVKGDFSGTTWTSELMIDAASLGVVVSTGKSAKSTRSAIVGDSANTDRTNSFWVDDFRIVCAAADPGWLT